MWCVFLCPIIRLTCFPPVHSRWRTQTFSKIIEGLYFATSKDSLSTEYKSPIIVLDKTLMKYQVAQSTERQNTVEGNLRLKWANDCCLFGSFI